MYKRTARDLIISILSDGSRRSVTEMFELTRAQGMTLSAYQSGIVYAEDSGDVTPVSERGNSVIYALTKLVSLEELTAVRAAEHETSEAIMAIIKARGAINKHQLKIISEISRFKIKTSIKHLIRTKQIYSFIDLNRGRCYQLSSVPRDNAVLRKSPLTRQCLRCQNDFFSNSAGNRICTVCKGVNREYSSSFTEIHINAYG